MVEGLCFLVGNGVVEDFDDDLEFAPARGARFEGFTRGDVLYHFLLPYLQLPLVLENERGEGMRGRTGGREGKDVLRRG